MAIEFNCPYCTATIRVPDAYAGKQGRCPKCDTKLLIPSVPLPHQHGVAHQSPVTSQLPYTPQWQDLPTASTPPTPSLPEAAAGMGQMLNPSAGNVQLSEDPFSVRPVTTATRKLRRRNARRRPSRALVIGIPVICFLILLGIISYSVTNSLPKLQGELTGHRMDGLMLPASVIPWSDLNLNEEDRKVLQQEFTSRPESLASQVLSCRLSGSTDGIQVTLSSQPESQWIVVDVTLQKPLAIWKRKEGPALNRIRLEEMRDTVKLYAKDKLLKANGQQIAIDAVAVRDKVALNACGGSLSYAIHAVTDSTIYPCAAEGDLGQLYFCLPKSVKSFKILGRTLTNGSLGFTGDYDVTIADVSVTTETPPPEKGTESQSMEPDSPAMDGEVPMSEENSEMMEPDMKMMEPDMKMMEPDMKMMDSDAMNEINNNN